MKLAITNQEEREDVMMYGDDPFYEDSIEKYGWVASQFE